MGTRADFYIGRGPKAEWIGSIAYDGYPDGIIPKSEEREPWPGDYKDEPWPTGEHLFDSKTADEFRSRLERYFMRRHDVTLPEQGWPWPWNNSNTSDFAYAFDDGKVYVTCFGHGWSEIGEYDPDSDDDIPKIPDSEWPDMSNRKRVALGSNRSGIIIVTSAD